MKFLLTGDPMVTERLQKGTDILIQETSGESAEQSLSISVTFQDADELYAKREGNSITIRCKEPAHYFRGLSWALHRSADTVSEKTETVCFPRDGFMLDCSRNSVFTTETVKAMIRKLARIGMNLLMLYTEETYEVPGEPYFGIYRGRYSREEIREMDDYAQIFGIELVPCIQTLAHLRNALKWPLGKDIRDTEDILMVGEKKVYDFIEELLVAVKDSFSTRRVHLGMDEAAQLGLGEYLKKNGYRESAKLMKEHSARVFAICQKLGLTPMIWSDMYITANTGGGYYDVDETTDTSGWEKPDKELGLVYWDYYNENGPLYRNMLRVHQELTNHLTFAGGVWMWNGIAPNYGRAFRCTVSALEACREYQVPEIFCTAWMDNGSETPLDAVYPGLVLFAHLGFHETVCKEDLKEEFEACTGGRLEDFWQLEAFDSLFTGMGNNMGSDNPSKYYLYQDNMLGMFDYHLKGIDTRTYYRDLALRMASCAQTSPAYADLFHFYEEFAQVLAQKADLGIRIKDAYDSKDLSTLRDICDKVIPNIIDHLWKMKTIREQLWLRDAKPFGYELLDIKLGGVLTRLASHKRRIESYLNGSVSRLEELEQERMPYFAVKEAKNHPVEESMLENRWHYIVSGCCLMDTI